MVLSEEWKEKLETAQDYSNDVLSGMIMAEAITKYKSKKWILDSIFFVRPTIVVTSIIDWLSCQDLKARKLAIQVLDLALQDDRLGPKSKELLKYLSIISVLQYDYEFHLVSKDLVKYEKLSKLYFNLASLQSFLAMQIEKWKANEIRNWKSFGKALFFENINRCRIALDSGQDYKDVLFVDDQQADHVLCCMQNRFKTTKVPNKNIDNN